MILLGDCLERLKELEENSVDAVVTDPPYGLKFMGKKWDYDVPSMAMWVECFRVLKPGGHLLSFGGTRTYHRLASAIEDAGFEIRDQLQWLFGSGFPKSLDISKGIDKHLGAKREVIGDAKRSGSNSRAFQSEDKTTAGLHFATAPATPEAYRYKGWGTALKPAHEVICLARKPFTEAQVMANLALECQSKLFAEIVTRYSQSNLSEETQQSIAQWLVEKGTLTQVALSEAMAMLQLKSADNSYLNTELSWLNVLDGIWTHANTCTTEMASSLTTDLKILKSLLLNDTQESTHDHARPIDPLSASPAANILNALELKLNFIHTSFAQDLVTSKDDLSSLRPNNEPIVLARKPLEKGLTVAENMLKWGVGGLNIDESRIGTEDNLNGGAYSNTDRENPFFKKLDAGAGEFKQPQGRWPANLLLDETAAEMLDEQVSQTMKMHSAGKARENNRDLSTDKKGMFPANGKGGHRFEDSSSGASRFFYVAKASKRERGEGNSHPTVKPIKLMEYLCKLITPPGGTILDPFCGSGSTGVAAFKNGFKFIGIEMNEEYCEIANKRIANAKEGA